MTIQKTVKDKPKAKRGGGRPRREFPESQRIEILKRICKGEPLMYILTSTDFPGETFFYEYLLKNNEFAEKYRLAKAYQANSYADKALLAVLTTHGRVKNRKAQQYEVQSAKNVADEYKWQAAKLAPAKYGRLEVEETAVIKKEITVKFEGVNGSIEEKDI